MKLVLMLAITIAVAAGCTSPYDTASITKAKEYLSQEYGVHSNLYCISAKSAVSEQDVVYVRCEDSLGQSYGVILIDGIIRD
jgi:uncharacterized lipoprotein YajG